MSSFAQRVNFFRSHTEEDINKHERQYLLGGKDHDDNNTNNNNNNNNTSTNNNEGTMVVLHSDGSTAATTMNKDNSESVGLLVDEPLPRSYNHSLAWFGAVGLLGFAVALIVICEEEGRDSRNADEHCVLLSLGIGLGAIVILNSLILLNGVYNYKSEFGQLILNMSIGFSSLSLLMTMVFAAACLIHWDVDGQPAHPLFFPVETVGVRHRYLIWGAALAICLALELLLFAVLGLANRLSWYGHDAVFNWTMKFFCFFIALAGAAMTTLGIYVWLNGEMDKVSNPAWIIGSAVVGVALFILGFMALFINTADRISDFLIWLPIISVCVLLFSIGNAVVAEPANVSQRRTLTLLSALIGIWGQLLTIAAVIAASNWRFNLKKASL